MSSRREVIIRTLKVVDRYGVVHAVPTSTSPETFQRCLDKYLDSHVNASGWLMSGGYHNHSLVRVVDDDQEVTCIMCIGKRPS